MRLIRAVRALLDFLYLAQYPSPHYRHHFPSQRRFVTIPQQQGYLYCPWARAHFDFPKMHSLIHYASSIILFGTTDNYNTEQSERLHIDFAKDAYRATNHKDEYPQMTAWLERREKIQTHTAYIRSQQGQIKHIHVSRSEWDSLGSNLSNQNDSVSICLQSQFR
ncbi:hypothetical protein BJV77DRAFT_85407 [Russula vinacea]|nr:hypothetical protein BJV77DRAFT_85407 [Russula vinacea]